MGNIKVVFFDLFFTLITPCYHLDKKPEPQIYKIAMEKMNCKPEECIFVGDGGSDELKGAKEAGMKTVFTEYLDLKSKEKQEKIMIFADYHIMDFDELISVLC